nr:hypothetical protein [Tanacetum cinerariifolium]
MDLTCFAIHCMSCYLDSCLLIAYEMGRWLRIRMRLFRTRRFNHISSSTLLISASHFLDSFPLITMLCKCKQSHRFDEKDVDGLHVSVMDSRCHTRWWSCQWKMVADSNALVQDKALQHVCDGSKNLYLFNLKSSSSNAHHYVCGSEKSNLKVVAYTKIKQLTLDLEVDMLRRFSL